MKKFKPKSALWQEVRKNDNVPGVSTYAQEDDNNMVLVIYVSNEKNPGKYPAWATYDKSFMKDIFKYVSDKPVPKLPADVMNYLVNNCIA